MGLNTSRPTSINPNSSPVDLEAGNIELKIHVWSGISGNIGHVTIETPSDYLSFWPAVPVNILDQQGKVTGVPARLLNFQQDCRSESADSQSFLLPDRVITLPVTYQELLVVNENIDKMKESVANGEVMYKLINFGSNSYNCISCTTAMLIGTRYEPLNNRKMERPAEFAERVESFKREQEHSLAPTRSA